MSSVIDDTDIIQHITVDEGKAILDLEARTYLGISGEEFIRRYITADLADLDPSAVATVSHTLPLAGVPRDAWKTANRAG